MNESDLILYGVPFSQPVRAVIWLLLYKGEPFEMRPINPGSAGRKGSRNPDFLAKNPAGTIPTLELASTGFTLGEGHAIMTYLCGTRGWHDVYPTEAEARARVDWYLHYHHRNVRPAAAGYVAPKVRKDLDIPEHRIQEAKSTLRRALSILETSWLGRGPYLTGAELTLADFSAYTEIGQLRAGFTNLFDFSNFPRMGAWLDTMKQVRGHDDAHVVLSELGDLSAAPPTMEALIDANKASLVRLKTKLDQLRRD